MESKAKQIIEQLSRSEVLGQLSRRELDQLAALAIRRSLRKGEILCFQGDEWRATLYIASGTLRSVINTSDGRQYVVSSWNPGEEFWSHTLLDGNPMPSTLETFKQSVIYQWPGDVAFDIVLRNQTATRALIQRQTKLIRRRRENIYNLAFNPVASRLAKLIIEKFMNVERSTVERDLTLEDMAFMVATSPEVICRILYQFQSEGFLQVNRANITLRDRAALEKLIIQD